MATIDDFLKLDLRVGTVLSAEEVEGSEKLIKQIVDFGPLPVIPAEAGIQKTDYDNGSPIKSGMTSEGSDEKRDIRQILSGIKKWYKPESLVGKQFVYVYNLEPRIMMGIESQGMIMATDTEKPIMLKPSKKVAPGSKVR